MFIMATSKAWTQTLKNLDSEKPGPWKTWNKYGMKKYVSPYRVIFYKDHAQCDLY